MANPEHASIAARVLSVDEELQKDKATRTVESEGSELVV
jgi:hypothetical protein